MPTKPELHTLHDATCFLQLGLCCSFLQSRRRQRRGRLGTHPQEKEQKKAHSDLFGSEDTRKITQYPRHSLKVIVPFMGPIAKSMCTSFGCPSFSVPLMNVWTKQKSRDMKRTMTKDKLRDLTREVEGWCTHGKPCIV